MKSLPPVYNASFTNELFEPPTMTPVYRPPETVPLQMERLDGVPGQPEEPMEGQQCIVTIPTEYPNDHIIWSMICFAYANPCCLGLAALIFSIKARDGNVRGDPNSARKHGGTARCLNIISTVLYFSTILLLTIVLIAVFVTLHYRGYS